MKSVLTSMAASSLLAALAIAQPPHRRERVERYTVTDLGTLGGDNSAAFGMNNAGWVAGSSNLAAGGPQHAFLWYGGGPLTDLGTLGGPNSGPNSGANGPNARGEAAIGSETSTPDPNGEDYCESGTHLQCLGAIWKNGALTPLPTLVGGHNANAFGLNNRGQVIGFAENGTRDPTCSTSTPYQVLRFEAVIWGPHGEIQKVRPLKGDTVGFAFGINDNGQVVGSSGLCQNTGLPPMYVNGPHAVLWERDGSATDLGNLGGTEGFNIATSVNNRGEVVGGAQSPQDGTSHAFLWTEETGMQDLGAFPGAVVTVAPCCNTINNRGEVVGFSIDMSGNSRALVWQHKVMRDLNTLIPPDSPLYLLAAFSINDAGEIVGQAMTQSGELRAFLATPRDR